MSEPCDGGGPVMNTDVHLWPKIQAPDAEYLAVYGVGDDAISIQVGYNVVVTKPIRAWYELQAENERQGRIIADYATELADKVREVELHQSALLKIRIALGLTRDSTDDLLEVIARRESWKESVLAKAGRMQEHVHLRLKDFSDESIQDFVDRANTIIDGYGERAEHLAAKLVEAQKDLEYKDAYYAQFDLVPKSQPQPVDDGAAEIAYDRAYCSGAQAGYNLGVTEDSAGLMDLIQRRTRDRIEFKEGLSAPLSAEQAALVAEYQPYMMDDIPHYIAVKLKQGDLLSAVHQGKNVVWSINGDEVHPDNAVKLGGSDNGQV